MHKAYTGKRVRKTYTNHKPPLSKKARLGQSGFFISLDKNQIGFCKNYGIKGKNVDNHVNAAQYNLTT